MINLPPTPIGVTDKWFYEVYRVLTQKIVDVLKVDLTTYGNSAGSSDTNMASFIFPIDGLYAPDQLLVIEGFGTFAANANNKRIKVVFGSTTIFDTGTITDNSGSWKIRADFFRILGTSQKYSSSYFSNGGGQMIQYGTATEDFGVKNTIKFVGVGVDASDVVQQGMTIKWIPAV